MADKSRALTLATEGDIAVLIFDAPGSRANLLNESVIAEFDEILSSLETRTDLTGLVLRSGKPGMFIAGVDLNILGSFPEPNPALAEHLSKDGREKLRRLSRLPFPTVAAVEGSCVGGGAEVSIWCDRRVFSNHESTQWGFPEVKFGILPGWGGTQRIPRMFGIYNAIDLQCGGELIKPSALWKLGVATDVVPSEKLMDAAKAVVRAEQESGQWKKDRAQWEKPIELNEDQQMFTMATAQGYLMQQTKGQYPAPLKILEVIVQGSLMSLDEGLALEAREFGQLMGTPISNSLIHIFFLTERMKKDKGVADERIQPRKIEKAGVVGSGIMGHGIAAASMKRGISVWLNDVDEAALIKGAQKALEIASFDKAVKGPGSQKLLEMAPRLKTTMNLADFADCDLVVEAIVEKLEVKKQLFQKIEPLVREDTILASNTSTISITEMAKALKHPERFVGIHFFNPVHKMMLVEVIRGAKTSDEAVAAAVAYVQRLGKYPVVVKDGPGFLVNRILSPYMAEACALLEEGASISDVDKAARKFGMPIGPIALYDVVGIDTAYNAGKVMAAAFAERAVQNRIIGLLFEKGRLGQKTGKGFFVYSGGKSPKGTEDEETEKLLASLCTSPRSISKEEITARLFLPMVIEASRLLEEGLVRGPHEVDAGVVFGIGFPPFRGGVCKYADSVGAAKIVQQLKPLLRLGKRFQPTEMLKNMASRGTRFYEK